MRRISILIITCFLSITNLFAGNPKGDPVFKIASFNIQYDNQRDKINTWEKRLPGVVAVFNKYQFDIVGAQEPYLSQLNDLMPQIPDYAYLGINILGDTTTVVLRRHHTPIFYKKEKFDVLDWGTFWYSETPDVPGKKGWDAYSPRICTWAKFKDKQSQKEFYIFNNHFDHLGDIARRESPKLLLAKIKEIADGYPVLTMGDFNTNQYHQNYKILSESGVVKDSYQIARNIRNSNTPTYNDYNPDQKGSSRIDHIYVSIKPEVKVKSYRIITDSYKGIYPSDHFPVLIEAEISEKIK